MTKISNVVTSTEKLDEIFNQSEIKKGILPSFQMPNIGENAKTVIFVPIIGADGIPHLIETVNLDSGPAQYVRLMEYGKPEVIYRQSLGDSMKPQMNAIRNAPENGFSSYEDFIGKTVSIIATPYSGYPCPKCGTKGCRVCGGTGMSKVFSMTLRKDLMTPSGQTKKKIEDQF